jgi:hypothetical protein
MNQFRDTYLNQGAFAISSRSDRSTLSFGKSSDHPPWDVRKRAGDVEAQLHRQSYSAELSSNVIGSMTKSTSRGRFNVSANEVIDIEISVEWEITLFSRVCPISVRVVLRITHRYTCVCFLRHVYYLWSFFSSFFRIACV